MWGRGRCQVSGVGCQKDAGAWCRTHNLREGVGRIGYRWPAAHAIFHRKTPLFAPRCVPAANVRKTLTRGVELTTRELIYERTARHGG